MTISQPENITPELPHPPGVHESEIRAMLFKVAGYEYAVEAHLVQEIIRGDHLSPMGGLPDYVEGIVSRQGHAIPVVNLRKRLGLPETEAASPAPTPARCIVVIKLPFGTAGFLADAATELLWIKAADIEAPSPLIEGLFQGHKEALRGITQQAGRLLILLDPLCLLTQAEAQAWPDLEAALQSTPDETLSQPDVHTANARRRLLIFELGDELYGIKASDIAEIRGLQPYTPLPNVPPCILGLINLRGAILPVTDLRRRFGLSLRPAGPNSRLIILKGPPELALWADSVCELARLPQSDFQPAPSGIASIAPEYYEQIALLGGRVVIELNATKLLADGVTS